MKKFLSSTFDRTLLLLFIAHVLALIWLGPDLRHAVAERTHDSSAWAVVLLVWSLVVMVYALLESGIDSESDGGYWRRF